MNKKLRDGPHFPPMDPGHDGHFKDIDQHHHFLGNAEIDKPPKDPPSHHQGNGHSKTDRGTGY